MLRITGGEFRGRSILAPKPVRGEDRTRPTQAKLRQALFNSLQAEIPDAKVLDLFAGSGALGFEALSRGAAHVVFVESARGATKLVAENARALQVSEQVTILAESFDRAVPTLLEQAPFDLVLADPPYAGGFESRLLNELPWENLIRVDGRFCLEWGSQKSQVAELPDQVGVLEKVRERNYGDSILTTYRRSR